MVLESTMICVDDSDYMRNGDFVPTRMAAMQDAVNIVAHTKTRSNPENNVGLLTMASSQVLTTLTTDPAKLMSKMLACQPEGSLQLMSGLRVAHLALKHRQGKNHKMRIIVFIGSPVEGLDTVELLRLAKRMKKEKVNVDIITFGEGNQEILQQFVDTLNGRDGTGSHLVVVPPGPTLTDALMGSPVLQSEDGVPMGAGGAGYEFGIDPNDDPELALALRVSMEEQRTRQENPNPNTEAPAVGGSTDEEQMLEKALAMSRGGGGGSTASSSGAAAATSMDFGSMTEEEQIAYAMQMSMQETGAPEPPAAAAAPGTSDSAVPERMEVDETVETSDAFKTVLEDAEFVQAVLEGLPDGAQVKKETLEAAQGLVTEIKEKEKKKETGAKTPGASSSKKPTPDKKKPDPKKK